MEGDPGGQKSDPGMQGCHDKATVEVMGNVHTAGPFEQKVPSPKQPAAFLKHDGKVGFCRPSGTGFSTKCNFTVRSVTFSPFSRYHYSAFPVQPFKFPFSVDCL